MTGRTTDIAREAGSRSDGRSPEVDGTGRAEVHASEQYIAEACVTWWRAPRTGCTAASRGLPAARG